MKTILNRSQNHYLKTISIFLIAVILITGVVSCEGEGETYALTMATSPAGGGTATDVTGTSPYASGTDVDIEAVAAAGYEFDSWTAPAGTFADPNSATTSFTMPAQDVTVTANFALVYYDFFLAASPAGGGTAILTGISPQPAGAVLNIEALPAVGYQFVEWTASAGSFDDSNSATTTFTMPAQDVTITAHFVGRINHFRGYFVDETTATNISEEVHLLDRFVSINTTVLLPYYFCNPTEKVHNDVVTPVYSPDHHLTIYMISPPLGWEEPGWWNVVVSNQFGEEQEILVWGPFGLAVPTQKVAPGGHEPPLELDHYLVYEVWDAPSVPDSIVLSDQFIAGQHVSNRQAHGLLAPVRKVHGTEITDPLNWNQHFTLYDITVDPQSFGTDVEIYNQFGSQSFAATDEATPLLVPSFMLSWEPTTPPLP